MTLRFDYSAARVDELGPTSLADGDALAKIGDGQVGFWSLPDQNTHAIDRVVNALPADIVSVLWLGMGGSSLGARTVVEALGGKAQSATTGAKQIPKFYFIDNSDPATLGGALESVDPRTTLVVVVSKSGGTLETIAQWLVVKDWQARNLSKDEIRLRTLAISDPCDGWLRQQCVAEAYPSLNIPKTVGGRFSVLTPVGLLPLRLMGLRPDDLLHGAKAMALRCAATESNPAALYAALQITHQRHHQRHIHVMMPYADRLRSLSQWFVQLWAESLGKANDLAGHKVFNGPTPLPAVGATDQHAQLQLFMEGPDDKTFSFIRVLETARDLMIPTHPSAPPELQGTSLQTLINLQCRATQDALSQAGRPNFEIVLDCLDANHLGALFFFLQAATYFAGVLCHIDPFDQPGVELAKRLTTQSLQGGATTTKNGNYVDVDVNF